MTRLSFGVQRNTSGTEGRILQWMGPGLGFVMKVRFPQGVGALESSGELPAHEHGRMHRVGLLRGLLMVAGVVGWPADPLDLCGCDGHSKRGHATDCAN